MQSAPPLATLMLSASPQQVHGGICNGHQDTDPTNESQRSCFFSGPLLLEPSDTHTASAPPQVSPSLKNDFVQGFFVLIKKLLVSDIFSPFRVNKTIEKVSSVFSSFGQTNVPLPFLPHPAFALNLTSPQSTLRTTAKPFETLFTMANRKKKELVKFFKTRFNLAECHKLLPDVHDTKVNQSYLY